MEALVAVSAVVVGICGYRTVTEILEDIERDGSMELLKELFAKVSASITHLSKRLCDLELARLEFWHNLSLTHKKRHTRNVLVKRHA